MKQSNNKFLTIPEASKTIGKSTKTIRRFILKNKDNPGIVRAIKLPKNPVLAYVVSLKALRKGFPAKKKYSLAEQERMVEDFFESNPEDKAYIEIAIWNAVNKYTILGLTQEKKIKLATKHLKQKVFEGKYNPRKAKKHPWVRKVATNYLINLQKEKSFQSPEILVAGVREDFTKEAKKRISDDPFLDAVDLSKKNKGVILRQYQSEFQKQKGGVDTFLRAGGKIKDRLPSYNVDQAEMEKRRRPPIVFVKHTNVRWKEVMTFYEWEYSRSKPKVSYDIQEGKRTSILEWKDNKIVNTKWLKETISQKNSRQWKKQNNIWEKIKIGDKEVYRRRINEWRKEKILVRKFGDIIQRGELDPKGWFYRKILDMGLWGGDVKEKRKTVKLKGDKEMAKELLMSVKELREKYKPEYKEALVESSEGIEESIEE